MRVHSPNQYLIPAQTWYEAAHWWKVSRVCFKFWRVYKYLNVSWRSTPDFAWCWFQIPILILNNNQPQLTTRWEGHQTAALDIPEQPLCSWKVLCAGKESSGCISMWKFDDFIVNLGCRRPPRRVRAYNSTNNQELNNTRLELHHNIYLVRLYG